jgi:hypothetical protein
LLNGCKKCRQVAGDTIMAKCQIFGMLRLVLPLRIEATNLSVYQNSQVASMQSKDEFKFRQWFSIRSLFCHSGDI